jgi:plasmid maintenance system antidote protein VapI
MTTAGIPPLENKGWGTRLARYFGTSADFWMNLQKTYELDLARQQIGKAIANIPRRAAEREPVSEQAG